MMLEKKKKKKRQRLKNEKGQDFIKWNTNQQQKKIEIIIKRFT